MEQYSLTQIIEWYGIYAVFALCTVEGDITLLTAGVMANGGFFGKYSFLKVLLAGTLGGVVGDTFGYFVGRVFRRSVSNYRYYQMAQPRIERLIENFGGLAVIFSKYIYGIRVAMCIFNGVGRMPIHRFLILDFISCFIWSFLLAGVGYFFSGAVTSIIGDFQQASIALFVVVVIGIIAFFLIEWLWLSKKVEQANPETIHKIEDKLEETLHNIEEKLHLPHHSKENEDIKDSKEVKETTNKEI